MNTLPVKNQPMNKRMSSKLQEVADYLLHESCDMVSADGKGNALTNCNHHARRFFRCWLDGSYNGADEYFHNIERWKKKNGARPKSADSL